ncbi:MAG: ABC transporter permease [Dehalococcoidia bacterium]|nr:ABC transporter permease [Dehalococcoidia bacterium]MDW8120022.1 ABC transporter permease [Chloroflexota bacterium]
MSTYVIQRLLAAVPVLMLVGLIVFALLRVTPGDPAAVLAGEHATPENIAQIRAKLGLDQPIYVQLGRWLGQILRGDLGDSLFTGYKVTTLIRQRLEPTISLAILAEIIAVSLALPMGILAAWRANSWIDRAVMVFAVLGFSVPVFWLGFNLIWLFSVNLNLLPAAGYTPISKGFWPWLRSLILPAVTLGLVFSALIARMTRASMLEILREDYIRTARAKGLGERAVLLRHALKNAAVPIVTIIGLGFAALITGVVVTETVYALPGLGRLIVDSMLRRDYPVIQGAILLVAFAYVFINLVVDLTYAYFDPRIRY